MSQCCMFSPMIHKTTLFQIWISDIAEAFSISNDLTHRTIKMWNYIVPCGYDLYAESESSHQRLCSSNKQWVIKGDALTWWPPPITTSRIKPLLNAITITIAATHLATDQTYTNLISCSAPISRRDPAHETHSKELGLCRSKPKT